MSSPQLLIDTIEMSFQINEDAKKSGKLVFEGEFTHCGRPTANKRIYTESLMKREAQRLLEGIANRKVYGELDHPEDGKTKFSRASHLITGLKVEDGRVIGRAEVLNTTAGKNLQAIIEAGGRVGVSSRGFGSTSTNENGEEVVQEDYRLLTYDVVVDPANSTSYPEARFEATDSGQAAYSESRDSMANEAEFAAMAKKVFDEQRAQIREEERAKLRAEMTQSPTVESVQRARVQAPDAGLKAKLVEQDLKLRELEAQNSKLAYLAKDTGFRYFLEKSIADDPHAKAIRNLVGDVSRFESKEDIVSAIQNARQSLSEQIQQAESELAERQREQDLVAQEHQALRARNQKLEEALAKSTELNNLLTVRLYAEQRAASHPLRKKILSMVESSDISSATQVDRIIESMAEPVRDTEDLDKVRARVRKRISGGFSPSAEMEERDSSTLEEDDSRQQQIDAKRADSFGIPLDEFNRLAGISAR